MKIIFSSKCLGYGSSANPESPNRVSAPCEYLSRKNFHFIEPQPCDESDLKLCHTNRLINFIKSENLNNGETPLLPGIFDYAKLSAGAAIKSAELSLEGEKAFSLMRPPGHHSEKDNFGGFCYFNNMAIAATSMLQRVDKVAIVDIDCHHGNGTEDIVFGNKKILFASLHQSPLYPGTGLVHRGNCLNYPLEPGTNEATYLEILARALSEVKKFNPDIVGVSAGFDTFKEDSLANIYLEKESYKKIGQMINELDKPVFSVLEGGYTSELAECIYQFLIGLEK